MPIDKTGARPYKAGFELGKNLVEVADILYLLDNAEQFLTGMLEAIEPKLKNIQERRQNRRKAARQPFRPNKLGGA